MACEKCEREGLSPRVITFTRCGRWETRVFCDHTYRRGSLSEEGEREGKTVHQATRILSRAKIEQRPKRKSPRHRRGPKVHYSEQMDAFILLNYDNTRSRGVMRLMRDEFEKRFGVYVTKSQIVGRWHRLKGEAQEIAKRVRQVPSLPVLKFMQGSADA